MVSYLERDREGVVFAVKYTCLLLLLVIALLAGCQENSSVSEGTSQDVSSASSAEENITDETSSMEQTSSEILLPPDPVYLPGGLLFVFPEGWQTIEGNGRLNAVSADGTLSAAAVFSPGKGQASLTPELLETKIFPELVKAWETYGMMDVLGEMGACALAHTEHPVVLLQGTYNGIPVFQKQLYLFLEDGYLTVTLTSYGKDQTDYLLTLFQ